jgi:hypothetical protein
LNPARLPIPSHWLAYGIILYFFPFVNRNEQILFGDLYIVKHGGENPLHFAQQRNSDLPHLRVRSAGGSQTEEVPPFAQIHGHDDFGFQAVGVAPLPRSSM